MKTALIQLCKSNGDIKNLNTKTHRHNNEENANGFLLTENTPSETPRHNNENSKKKKSSYTRPFASHIYLNEQLRFFVVFLLLLLLVVVIPLFHRHIFP